jgi:hypothetical protein
LRVDHRLRRVDLRHLHLRDHDTSAIEVENFLGQLLHLELDAARAPVNIG